jgi:hypothetical protein
VGGFDRNQQLMTLRGLPLVLQAALFDGLAFDPFSLQ